MQCFRPQLALPLGLSMLGLAAEAIAGPPCLLAQAHFAVTESYGSWLVRSLGFFGLMTHLTGAAVFVGACLVVWRARRPSVIASYLVFLLLPLLLGILGALKGSVSSFAVLAIADVEIKQSQIFAGICEALLLPLSALVVTLPSYLVVAVGLFVRTATTDAS